MAPEEGDASAKVADASDPEAGTLDFTVLEETIPHMYIRECLSLLRQLELRLQADIYRGILLEVVQRIIGDI